ncbi:MAG: hypothetical protein H7Y16_02590 [Candidatus Parcubacteria bacterium]|nr:hypothetical protein [Burkholderiales bacterium]
MAQQKIQPDENRKPGSASPDDNTRPRNPDQQKPDPSGSEGRSVTEDQETGRAEKRDSGRGDGGSARTR